MAKKTLLYIIGFAVLLALAFSLAPGPRVTAQQGGGPVLFDPSLDVRVAVDGLNAPTTMAFLDEDEFFILEKGTGQVKHVVGDTVQATVLDLAVNAASEFGLLGIALDPDFASNGYVYLYWTCQAPAPTDSPYFPTEIECEDEPQLGDDTDDPLAVPLLGHRVDRFVWDSNSLTWDLNLVKLRSFQNDGAPIPRGQEDEEQGPAANHAGGVITFGMDGKLYIIMGDAGRRGALQNLPFGPIDYNGDEGAENPAGLLTNDLAGVPLGRYQTEADDQFGGPFPDDAHYAGVILRLNTDGSIPEDNPFYDVGADIGGEIGENIQMTFGYGIRNSFGMDVDPMSGNVWITENGEDAFDEINRMYPGRNSGWIQIQGPLNRLHDYKQIEATEAWNEPFPNLQQLRWSPENIADSEQEALRRLYDLPGSTFSNPEFSWKYVTAPAALGFVKSDALGSDYQGDFFIGFSEPEPLGGALFHFNVADDRMRLQFDDPALNDRVADNSQPHDLTESESFLFGTGFGIVTDIKTGPNGHVYVVSLIEGIVYEIFPRTGPMPSVFVTELTGEAEVPGPGDPDGSGAAFVVVDEEASEICFALVVANITLPATAAHIHVGEEGVPGDVVVPLAAPDEVGTAYGCVSGVVPDLIAAIVADPAGYYVNVHTEDFPAGAVRGQLAGSGSDR